MYRRLSIVLLGLFALVIQLGAQETINNASLAGRVTDTSGAVIRDAAVSAARRFTGVTFNTTTDTAGPFSFSLPSGWAPTR